MDAAYCPDCRERGPDVRLDDIEDEPPLEFLAKRGATSFKFGFTCGRCAARWTWEASPTAHGLIYQNPERDSTH